MCRILQLWILDHLHSTLVILQSAIDTVATVATGSTFHSGYITIGKGSGSGCPWISTFHSGYITIMPWLINFPRMKIYIPLWLYYNRKGWTSQNDRNDIYIPLWLYYNPREIIEYEHDVQSTFHSGYITINAIQYNKVALKNIYIPLWLYYNLLSTEQRWLESYLHSTLVILQSICTGICSRLYLYLHSTLVILQYCVSELGLHHLHNLHSTLVILQSNKTYDDSIIYNNLHSTLVILQ